MMDDQVTADGYETLLDMLVSTYPSVVVDLSATTADMKRTVIKRAQKLVIVSTASLSSVRAARSLMQEAKTLRGDSDAEIEIVINKQGETSGEVPKAQIEEGLERKDITYISYNADLFSELEAEAKRLSTDKASQDITAKLLKLVGKKASASNENDAQKGVLGQFIDKLKTKS